MRSVSHLVHDLDVAQRLLNDSAHDDQVACRDERHETRHQYPVPVLPMIDAGVPVGEFLGPNMGDDIFGTAIEIRSEVVAHGCCSPLPHKAKAKQTTTGTQRNINRGQHKEIRFRAASCPIAKQPAGHCAVASRCTA